MHNFGLGSWPERRLSLSPDKDALWFEGVTTSHREFALRVRQVAGVLATAGARTGDRVAWFGANHPAALETLYACGQLGAIWVPVNARLTAGEAEYVLSHSGARVIVHGADTAQVMDELRDRLPDVVSRLAVETPDPDAYDAAVAAADPQVRDVPVTLEDPCLIMYTSGTTGHSKGAVLTHGNMTWNAINQSLGFDFSADERTLALAPLFHIGGLNGTVNPTLLRGGCAVLMRRFDAATALDVIETQRVNSFFAVPTMLDLISREPDFAERNLSALRTIGAAGAPLPLPLLRTWLGRGVTVQQAYGMTEAAPGCTVLDSADARRKVGSAGKPMFFTDIRVVRSDGSAAAPNEVGEITVSGPNVMAGYWNDPQRTAQVLVDGWYHSGDAGSFDDDGFLYIRDRYNDMIISGGENVYPAEIESALLELPSVLEAAVIGVPDARWGEVGLAVLVAAPEANLSPESVRQAMRERLAGFKVPHYVKFVDEMPKTATGKIRKPDLRIRYAPAKETL